MSAIGSTSVPTRRGVFAGGGTGWWLGALGLVLAVRVLQVSFSAASLHVDEAQYWDWSQRLQAGYHTKPPLVAWLIAASRTAFGDGELGVRALGLLCWPATAAVLGVLAADVAGRAQAAPWAAAVWLATPLAGLLGLVATTDGPLLLLWSVALLALWRACVRASDGAWWLLGLALGLALLTKYTAAALLAGAWLFVLSRRRRREVTGLLLASALALALLLPHLGWSHLQGWVTLRHTAEITVQAHALPGRAGGLLAVAEGLGGQALAFAPLLLPLLPWWPRRPRPDLGTPPPWRPFLLLTSLPLLLAGLGQAWRAGVQLNWLAPLHLALALWLALALQAAPARWRQCLGALLAAQFVLVVGLSLLPAWAAAQHRLLPAWADGWARMRGWDQTLKPFVPLLRQLPDARVLTASRSVMAQAAYHWRGQGIARQAWAPAAQPRHHYESACPWRAGQPLPTHVLLDEPADPALLAALGPLVLQARSEVVLNQRRHRELTLWRVVQAPATANGVSTCR